LTLAQDQLATVKPDVTAFRDHEDVLRRLVPYHLWQIPEDDLHGPLGAPSRKGKGRARDWDVAEAEAEIEERRGPSSARPRMPLCQRTMLNVSTLLLGSAEGGHRLRKAEAQARRALCAAAPARRPRTSPPPSPGESEFTRLVKPA
jgi:hypothetical protein